jgi:TonB family protein
VKPRLLALFLLLVVQPVAEGLSRAQTYDYREGKDGFQQFMTDLVNMRKSGETESFQALLQDAVLPNAGAWFTEAFGAFLGGAIARGYATRSGDVGPFLVRALDEAEKLNLREFEVVERKGIQLELGGKPPSIGGVSLQAARPLALYGARFFSDRKKKKDGDWLGLWYFVHVNGAYRFVGLLEAGCERAVGQATPSPAGQARMRVGGNVQQARLLRLSRPAYPPLARQARIQGTVRLQAIIDKRGCVANLEVLEGHPLLVQTALEAVREWMYSPTFLENEPVEVVTTIDVVFRL